MPSGAPPNFLQLGPDGSKWFGEPSGVGRLSPSGTITEWTVTLEHADDHIEQISLDRGGDLWFAELNYDGPGPAGSNLVRRLDPRTNVISEYRVPTLGGCPAGVLADGAFVWVSEYTAGRLARLDPATAPHTNRVVAPRTGTAAPVVTAEVASPPLPTPGTRSAAPATTTRITPVVSPGWVEYPLPTAGAQAEDMRLGEGGRLYFEEDNGKLGVLNVAASQVTEYPIPSPDSGYYNIALGPEGQVWFAEAGAFGPVPTKIGVLRPE